jgi:hypothetical protein
MCGKRERSREWGVAAHTIELVDREPDVIGPPIRRQRGHFRGHPLQ